MQTQQFAQSPTQDKCQTSKSKQLIISSSLVHLSNQHFNDELFLASSQINAIENQQENTEAPIEFDISHNTNTKWNRNLQTNTIEHASTTKKMLKKPRSRDSLGINKLTAVETTDEITNVLINNQVDIESSDLKRAHVAPEELFIKQVNNSSHQEADSSQHTAINLSNTKKYSIEYPIKLIRHDTEGNFIALYLIKKLVLMLINFIIILPCCVYLCLIFSFSYLFKLSYKLFYLYNLTSAQRYYANTMPQFLNPIELFWLYNSSLKSNNRNKSIGSCITFIEGNLSKNNLKN